MKTVEQIDGQTVLSYFEKRSVLDHYEDATKRVGLWASEEIVFKHSFPKYSTKLLELGCGAGRISFSLWMMGYENLTATDVSKKMVKRAINIQNKRKSLIQFDQEDATQLSFKSNFFDFLSKATINLQFLFLAKSLRAFVGLFIVVVAI